MSARRQAFLSWLRLPEVAAVLGDACLCGRSHKGRQHRFASGVRSWAQAEERREEVQNRLDSGETTPLSKSPVENQKTIAQAVETFLLAKEGEGLSKATMRKLRYQLPLFEQFMSTRSRFFPSEITPTDVIEYRATWQWKSGVTRQKRPAEPTGIPPLLLQGQCEGTTRCPEANQMLKADNARLEPQPFTEQELKTLLAQVPQDIS